jgi:hypothetical protein
MAAPLNAITYVGDETTPIALGANASATDVWTWTHSQGRKAIKLEVLDATSRQVVGPATIAPGVTAVGLIVIATQTTADIITLTNQSTIAQDVILRVTWEDPSASVGAPVLASVGVLS